MQVGLISCTKSKQEHPDVPRELYEPSALFRKARTYCDQHHDAWYVLSAKHGLLAPDGPEIAPYDETVTDAPVEERRTWAARVAEQLADAGVLDDEVELILHAGNAYYEPLLPHIESEVADIRIPTAGLGIGESLAWYNEHNR